MPTHDDARDLSRLRLDAGLSQEQLAEHLGLSQSQISRYEMNPEDISVGLYRRWLSICGEMSSAQGIKIDDPRTEIKGRLKLISDYLTVAPPKCDQFVTRHPEITAESFSASLNVVSKKPRVGVFGHFDSGKSRLLNVLLGGNHLPTSYQPETSAVFLIRHIKFKPAWQSENVWLMKKGFDLDRADDKEHCEAHKLLAGSYESLTEYASHKSTNKSEHVVAAVTYIDSPLLLAADIVDLPGYGNNEDDQYRAELARKTVDVLVYLSPAIGFLGKNDCSYISALLRTLPSLANKTVKTANPPDGITPLRNVYVVATQAHIPTQAERVHILDVAAERTFKCLEIPLGERAEITGSKIQASDLRSRFFTFSADDSLIRKDFESDLINLLTKIVPERTLREIGQHIQMAKRTAADLCNGWIQHLQTALDERDRAQKELEEIIANEPQRIRRNSEEMESIMSDISTYSDESDTAIEEIFSELANLSYVEAMIQKRYDNKKEAQQYAASYLTDLIQKRINDRVQHRAEKLGNRVEQFLEEYGPTINTETMKPGAFDFNPRVAFMSALSGIGTIGALAAWASIAAAGSNLGGYILVAEIVGWLSSIGISIGSASSVMAAVSAIGGPITLGIAAGILAAVAVFAIFGDSWQTKLAKKILDGLKKQKAQDAFRKGVRKYWNDTKNAFEIATQKTEETFQDYLASLTRLAFETDREDLEKELKCSKDTHDFFVGIPWRAIE